MKADKLNIPNPDAPGAVEHQQKIVDSPILNMAYLQKKNNVMECSPRSWRVKPISFFSNENMYGSVSQTIAGRFYVINIIRRDSDSSVFIPTMYLPDNSPNSKGKINNAIDVLQIKHGIFLPKWGRESERAKGLVIFTQAESVGNNKNGLFKVWRPAIHYMEPSLLNITLRGYYKLSDHFNVRLVEFDSIETLDSIKDHVDQNTLETWRVAQKYPGGKKVRAHMLRTLTNEMKADRIFNGIVQYYLEKGAKRSNNTEYLLSREIPAGFKETHTMRGLWRTVDKEVSAEVRRLRKGKFPAISPVDEALQELESQIKGFTDNNRYSDKFKHHEVRVRRDYSIDYTTIKAPFNFSTYYRIHNVGVIEGFKAQNQTLGEIDSTFVVGLNESRAALMKTIGEKFCKDGKFSEITGDSIYAVSINRVSFEFFEIRPNSNIYGYLTCKNRPSDIDCEVYSIIDTLNDGCKFTCETNLEKFDTVIPKHDYNILDDLDEHSIRKFMDLVYENPNGDLSYKSYESNIEQMFLRENHQDLYKKYVSDSNCAKTLAEHKYRPTRVKRLKIGWSTKTKFRMVPYKIVKIGSIPLGKSIQRVKVQEAVGYYRRKRIKVFHTGGQG